MFVAIITRIRYFGGGFGWMPSARRKTRLTSPRGFLRPGELGEQRLQRAHAAAAHAIIPPIIFEATASVRAFEAEVSTRASLRTGVAGSVGRSSPLQPSSVSKDRAAAAIDRRRPRPA